MASTDLEDSVDGGAYTLRAQRHDGREAGGAGPRSLNAEIRPASGERVVRQVAQEEGTGSMSEALERLGSDGEGGADAVEDGDRVLDNLAVLGDGREISRIKVTRGSSTSNTADVDRSSHSSSSEGARSAVARSVGYDDLVGSSLDNLSSDDPWVVAVGLCSDRADGGCRSSHGEESKSHDTSEHVWIRR